MNKIEFEEIKAKTKNFIISQNHKMAKKDKSLKRYRRIIFIQAVAILIFVCMTFLAPIWYQDIKETNKRIESKLNTIQYLAKSKAIEITGQSTWEDKQKQKSATSAPTKW